MTEPIDVFAHLVAANVNAALRHLGAYDDDPTDFDSLDAANEYASKALDLARQSRLEFIARLSGVDHVERNGFAAVTARAAELAAIPGLCGVCGTIDPRAHDLAKHVAANVLIDASQGQAYSAGPLAEDLLK